MVDNKYLRKEIHRLTRQHVEAKLAANEVLLKLTEAKRSHGATRLGPNPTPKDVAERQKTIAAVRDWGAAHQRALLTVSGRGAELTAAREALTAWQAEECSRDILTAYESYAACFLDAAREMLDADVFAAICRESLIQQHGAGKRARAAFLATRLSPQERG